METSTIVQITGLVSGPVVPLLLFLLREKNIKLKWLLDAELTNKWPKSLKDDLSDANELWFYGIHLKDTVQNYYKLFHEKANTRKRLRFLIADPEGVVFQMVKKRFHGDHGKAEKENAIQTLNTLFELHQNYPDAVEIRTLDYLFPRTVYMINPTSDKAVAYVSQHTFRLNNEKTKMKYSNGRGNHYDLIYREYCNFWEVSEPVQGRFN